MRIENRLADIRRAVGLVEQFGAENGVPPAIIGDVNVALDEALSNVIAHGYDGQAAGEIIISLSYEADELRVEIEDDGRAFDPLQAPPPDLDASLQDRKVGGLGVHLMRSLMDQVSYQRIDGRNRLRMVRKVARGGAGSVEPRIAIIEPRGRIDSVSARGFGDQLIQLIRAGARHMLIDLHEIAYVSSAGFRAFLIAHKLMDQANGMIVLCGMSPGLNRLFEIGQFTDLFTVCATRDEGLAKARLRH